MHILRKFVFICCLSLAFIPSAIRAAFGGCDASDPTSWLPKIIPVCVAIKDGKAINIHAYYDEGVLEVDLQEAIDTVGLNFATVISDDEGLYEDWDLKKYGTGLKVIASSGVTYTFDYFSNVDYLGFYEATNTLDTSSSGSNFLTLDPVADEVGNAYILFQIDGTVVQTTGSFYNQGETYIATDGSFSFSDGGIKSIYFASDIIRIGSDGGSSIGGGGGSSGATAELIVESSSFGFNIIDIQNGSLTIENENPGTAFAAPSIAADKYIYMHGGASISVINTDLEFMDFLQAINISIEGDNNLISLDIALFSWHKIDDPSNIPGYDPKKQVNIDVTCSSTCISNKLYTYGAFSQLAIDEFTLTDVDTFTIESLGNSQVDINTLVLKNSDLVFEVSSASAWTLGFYQLYAEVNVDENSSLIFNAPLGSGNILISNIDFIIDGIFEINADTSSITASLRGAEHGYLNMTMGSTASVVWNFKGSSFVNYNLDMNLLSGTLYVNLKGQSTFRFGATQSQIDNGAADKLVDTAITGDGKLVISIEDNSVVNLRNTTIEAAVDINQVVYTSSDKRTLLRFNKADIFLDDDLTYQYSVNVAATRGDFRVSDFKSGDNSIVMVQIKNNDASGNFDESVANEVIAKIDAGGDGLGDIDSGGDGGDGGSDLGGGGDIDSSLSVLINYQSTRNGKAITETDNGIGLIDYQIIGGEEYAEFGFLVGGSDLGDLGGGGDGTWTLLKAQDQYGEEEGLLTLTTIENTNSYGIAVAYDNIIFSETDSGNYRKELFNIVIYNSRTVEQLGQTLSALGSNPTLGTVMYGSTVLELSDKRNADSILGGDRFTTYAEVRDLTGEGFKGNYVVLGLYLMLLETEVLRFGVSGFYSPYTFTTNFDHKETIGNASVSAFFALQVGPTALMVDASVMHSSANGTALENLSPENMREYMYESNAASATVSLNFGSYFSQRMIVAAYVNQGAVYNENISDLALSVTMPNYYNAFAGYYSKLINTATLTLEFGLKYYFKEGQMEGSAGFINDPSLQIWNYQYILPDSPIEVNLDVAYRLASSLELKGGFNKRGTFSSFGIYLMYRKSIYDDEVGTTAAYSDTSDYTYE